MSTKKKDDVREIMQLWNAAELYWGLLPNNINEATMNKTVHDWSDECENSDTYQKNPLFTYCCHLASCAIRLYSIDEKRKLKRYTNYNAWWKPNNGKSKCIDDFSEYELHCMIHCVLRNIVAHNEKEAEGSKFNYDEIRNYYFDQSFNDLGNGMKDVVNLIAEDLNSGKGGDVIEVKSFV